MNFSRVLVVAKKELMDASRDRRSIYAILFGSLVGPLLVMFMFNRMAEQQRSAEEIKVPVVGREYAPVLVRWLEQQSGVEVIVGPADPEVAVRDRNEPVVVVIPKEFGEKFRDSFPAPVKVVSDGTRTSARSRVERVKSLLRRYSAEIGALRLINRGVSPSIASALEVKDIEVSSAQQRAAMILNMIPLFVLLSALVSGMQIATDATAGERERGSLEPLLVNPVPRIEIVMGKWLAAASSASAGMVLTLALVTTALFRIPLQDFGMRFRFGTLEGLLLLLAALPMAVVAPAIQIYFASFARSFKEAQQYMSYLIMIPMLPAVLSPFYPLNGHPWLGVFPVLGQYVLAVDVVGGKQPAPVWFIVAAISAVTVAGVFLWLTARLFQRDKIIFGR